MYAVKREEAVAEVHFAGRGIPDTRRYDWQETLGAGDPAKHHEVRVNYLFGFSALEIKPFRQIELTRLAGDLDRVRYGFIGKHEHGFLLGAIHSQPMVRFAVGSHAVKLQPPHFYFREPAWSLHFLGLALKPPRKETERRRTLATLEQTRSFEIRTTPLAIRACHRCKE